MLTVDALYKSMRWMDVSTNCPQLTIMALKGEMIATESSFLRSDPL